MSDFESMQKFAELILKSVIAISIGAFGLLVGYGNIVDYNANWQFVQHVLEMDAFESWFDSSVVQSRAIASEPVQRIFYGAIILGELVAGILFSAGGVMILFSAFQRNSPALGKTVVVAGAAVAILIWHTGFAVIGAEWFAMWASSWNGQDKAYTFATFILLGVLYITRRE